MLEDGNAPLSLSQAVLLMRSKNGSARLLHANNSAVKCHTTRIASDRLFLNEGARPIEQGKNWSCLLSIPRGHFSYACLISPR